MKGISLVEVLVVLGIITTIIAVGAPFYTSYHYRHLLAETTQEIVESIRVAQARAMAGYNGENHGIHFDSNRYVLFSGSSYNPADPNNLTYPISSKLSISNVSFNGNTELIFERFTGNATPGTLYVMASPDDIFVISVSEIGVVNSYQQ